MTFQTYLHYKKIIKHIDKGELHFISNEYASILNNLYERKLIKASLPHYGGEHLYLTTKEGSSIQIRNTLLKTVILTLLKQQEMDTIKYEYVDEKDFKQTDFEININQHNLAKEITQKIDKSEKFILVDKTGTKLMCFVNLAVNRLAKELGEQEYKITIEKINKN